MTYLIDGHNLIPHIPGLSLTDLEDEQALIDRLQAFCGKRRKRAEIYFDQAPPGRAGQRSFGLVSAHFVQQGMTADEAIRRRLDRLGKAAANWTVVSSDHQVQAEARSHRARVISSSDFAREIEDQGPGGNGPEGQRKLSEEEIKRWMRLFGDEGERDNLE
jgi:predicted RNA-binding protein with PIN domain